MKQLQTQAPGLYWVFSEAEYLHLFPAAISGVPPGGWRREGEVDNPTSQSCSGAVWEMPKLCAKVPAMLRLLPRTPMAQTTCTKKMLLEQSPTHPALHHRAAKSSSLGAPCKRAKAADISSNPCCRLSRQHCAVCLCGSWHWLLPASEGGTGWGGKNRVITVERQLIRKAARFVDLPDKLRDVPPHLINAKEAGRPREISQAPHLYPGN